jgi:hypothetical protein
MQIHIQHKEEKSMSTPAEIIYDEARVPAYSLPDPLLFADGAPVDSAEAWQRRRAEILSDFEDYVYGKTPLDPLETVFETRSVDPHALNGSATRKEICLHFNRAGKTAQMDLLLYLPNAAARPVAVFIGLNFEGNHTVHSDPGISLPRSWVPDYNSAVGHRASEAGRGSSASRWQVERILARGYGVATIYCGDLEPDFDGGIADGVRALFFPAGQDKPGPGEWGALGAWGWGLSRAMDYFETDPQVDAQRVALVGHSRLGKAALWAGAQDTRFALVISNDSGCGGAALSRRMFGETVAVITQTFPYWFCRHFSHYARREEFLPVDQHMLLALIAPRPLYVASASEDLWADPRGEFLSAHFADPVYRLLGTAGLPVEAMPAPDQPATGQIAYHLRSGGHDITQYDWERYLDFADMHLKANH